jgi:hypothetical protein
LQCESDHFGWVHYTGFHQIFIGVGIGIVTKSAFAVFYFIDDDRTFRTGIVGNLTKWLLHGTHDDFHPQLLIGFDFHFLQRGQTSNQRNAPARHDPFLYCRTGRIEGIFNPGFFLFHFCLSGRAHVDHRHPADQFGQPFLQFFTIVVGGGLIDLSANLLDPALDGRARTGAVNDGGVVLIDVDPFGVCRGLKRPSFPI